MLMTNDKAEFSVQNQCRRYGSESRPVTADARFRLLDIHWTISSFGFKSQALASACEQRTELSVCGSLDLAGDRGERPGVREDRVSQVLAAILPLLVVRGKQKGPPFTCWALAYLHLEPGCSASGGGMRRITSCTTFFFEWTFEWTTLPKVAGGDFSFLRIDGWFRALWRGVVGDRLQRLFSAHGREGLGKN